MIKKETIYLFNRLNKLVNINYIQEHLRLQFLEKLPRYTPHKTKILGHEIHLVDGASFVFMYREIFKQQIYRFKAKKNNPYIVDGGANIGLSTIYFKQLYPQSKVIAFEPDVKVFQVLKENINQLNLLDIDLINKAVWSSETTLEFMSEGADGGRLTNIEPNQEKYLVQTVRLKDYLNQPIDFLKLDIEGAETEVIKDCRDSFHNVQNIFVEYHSFINEPQSLHIILNILSETGFRIHIHPPVVSPQPFYHRNVHLGMDMQLNIFAFREENKI